MTDPILAYISERLHKHRQHAPRAPRDSWSTAAIAAHYAVDTELKSLIRNITAGEHLPAPSPQAQDFQKLADELEAEALKEACPWCGVAPGEPCFKKTPCLPHEWRHAMAGVVVRGREKERRAAAIEKECPDCQAPPGVRCLDHVNRDPVD